MHTEPYVWNQFSIRPDMLDAIDRYINHGIDPGSFLRAVLENNFVNACGQADQDNLANLPAYASYLYSEIPSAAWGSQAHVRAWIEMKSNVPSEANP